MAKTSGKNRTIKKTGGLAPMDWNPSFDVENVEDLVKIKHPDVYREMKQAISRFESELGVRDRIVKIADMPSNVNGVHMTTIVTGENAGIYLNKSVFNKTKSEIIARTRLGYKLEDRETGLPWSTRTNKPIQHTITHELAHGLWNPAHESAILGKGTAKYRAAGVEIRSLYKKWLNDPKYRRQKGYGQYATTRVAEFFAEAITKHVHGNADYYTKRLANIVKKYKL